MQSRARTFTAPFYLARLLFLALVVVGLATGVAWAHPSLVRSEPAANSTLDEAPRRVTAWFNEALEPDYASLAVYDAQGARVDNLDAQFVPGAEPAVTVSLPPLPRGSYVAAWRVVSVGDGHAVGGAFAFGVGVPPDLNAAAAASAQAETGPDAVSHLIRYLGLLAQLVFLGAMAFRSLVWAPAGTVAALGEAGAQALAREQRRYLTVLADVLVGALVIGVLGALYVQARDTGVYFWQLFGTRWGVVWLARFGLAALAAVWLEPLLEGRRPAWQGWALGLGLVLVITLTSHSASLTSLTGMAADFAHQTAAGVWLGGLLLLVVGLLSLRAVPAEPEARARLSGEWVARFAGLAAACVGLLLASGLVLSVQQVVTWAGLLLTAYGQVLLAKLAVVAAALIFAAYNALSAPRRASRGPVWLALEAVLIAGVLLGAGVLTDLPPAATAVADPNAPGDALSLEARAVDLEVTAALRPARAGANLFTVEVRDPAGSPVREADVALHFEPVGGGGLASQLALAEDPAQPGTYTGTGSGLSRQGPWQVLVTVVQPGRAAPSYANFDVEVGLDNVVRPAGAPLPLNVRAVAWLNRYGRAVLSVVALVVAIAWAWLARRAVTALNRAGWLAAGVLAAVLIWLLSLALF